jgi:5-methylcytosine-specific restriction endonuclease McrA
MRSCFRCGDPQPEATGKTRYCKPCQKAYHREWYLRNRERRLAMSREWKRANEERYKAQQHEYRTTPERREAGRLSMAKWRAENPERAREMWREWAQRNPDKRREKFQRYKARLRNAPVVEIIDRAYVYDRDNGMCHICRRKVARKSFTLDHLVPLARGGEHSTRNVRVAHFSCNSRRGADRLPAQLLLVA